MKADLEKAVKSFDQQLLAAAGSTDVEVYTRNRRSAKLHKLGGCEWTRSTLNDTQEFEAVTGQMYKSRCKLCGARKLEATGQALGDDSSSDQSAL
jgi:hypothetical protein